LALGNVTAAGALNVTAAGAITNSGDVTAAADANLTAGGAITSSGALKVSGTTTLAAADEAGVANDITLNNSANDFGTVVVTSGNNVTLNDVNDLVLGNVTAAGALNVTAAGDLLLNSGASIAATGAVANPLVLVAGRNFINNSGASALNAGDDRWLVYSTSPDGSTENGLTAVAGSTSPRLYNRTFAHNAPSTIVAGNHLIYSTQPTLTMTADNKTRVYGAANPAFTATTTGFVTDDGVTDTLTMAGLTGATALTSSATATSPVSSITTSPFEITAATGDLASSAGYAFGFAHGSLTITPATLTLSGTRVYDAGTSFAGQYLTAGGVNGETFAIDGDGTATNLASKDVAANQGVALRDVTGLNLGTSVNGGLASNYNPLSSVGSIVSLSKANATVTANSREATFNGQTQSVSGFSASGLVGGETEAVLTAVSTSGGSGRNPGSYAHTASGTDGNYNLSFFDGALTIKATFEAPPPIVIPTGQFNNSSSFVIRPLASSVSAQPATAGPAGGATPMSSSGTGDTTVGNTATSTSSGATSESAATGGLPADGDSREEDDDQ
jgi:hypothetical protein